jgi:hypothetical protein
MQSYLKAFTAVFTFTIGTLAAFFLMPLPDVPVVHDVRFDKAGSAPETVSLCELAGRTGRYDGKLVRVEANIEFNNAGVSSLTDDACLQKWVRLSCDAGYESCRGLLEKVQRSDAGGARIVAIGRFFASVLERVPGGINTRVPLFEITETKVLEIKGGSEIQGVGDEYNPCKYDGRRCGYGSGTGSGQGTGSGSGSGTETGYAANTTSGTGPGRGGGGSGGQ